jgi:hypothetical protein
MSDNSNLPALSKQVTELVLAGSLSHAEEALPKPPTSSATWPWWKCSTTSRRK